MKEYLLAAVVIPIIVGFLFYSVGNWLMLPGYISQIGDELREIKEILKERK